MRASCGQISFAKTRARWNQCMAVLQTQKALKLLKISLVYLRLRH